MGGAGAGAGAVRVRYRMIEQGFLEYFYTATGPCNAAIEWGLAPPLRRLVA